MNDCCVKKKVRQPEELKKLQNRLKRIEGQVRGLQKMLDENAYCTDILTQTYAVQSALSAFSRELLDEHIRSCVVNEVRSGDDEVISDLVNTIHRMIK